jgi:hypothetical protein
METIAESYFDDNQREAIYRVICAKIPDFRNQTGAEKNRGQTKMLFYNFSYARSDPRK